MNRLLASIGLSAAVMTLLTAESAFAQAAGGCASGAPQVTPSIASGFKADPSAFLAGLSAGNQDVADTVRRLAIQDPSALNGPALAAAAKSSPAMSTAIARGLGAAARACVDVQRPELAASIQATVLTQFDSAFQAEFARATSDTRTTATSAAGAGAGGGGGVNGTGLGTGRTAGPTVGPSELFRNSGFTITTATGTLPTVTDRNSSANTTILLTRTINGSASPTSISGF